MAKRKLRVLEEEPDINASNKQLCLLALKLDADALWQGPCELPSRLQAVQPIYLHKTCPDIDDAVPGLTSIHTDQNVHGAICPSQ